MTTKQKDTDMDIDMELPAMSTFLDEHPLPITNAKDEDQGISSENEHEASTTLEPVRSAADADSAAPIPIEDQLAQPIRNFDVNEQVLVYHKGLIYEAKILKTIIENGIFIYLIHYSGWSKKWDEWISEDILLKLNEANLEKQRVLKEERQKSSKKKISLKAKSKSLTPSGPGDTSIGKRRKTDVEDNDASLNTSSALGSSLIASASTSNSEVPSNSRLDIKLNLSASEGTGQTSIFQKLLSGRAIPEGQPLQDVFEKVEMPEDTTNEQQSQSNEELGKEYRQYQEVIIKIPEGLKKVLVNDWFEIRKNKKIINLPIDPSRNIDAILHEYETSSENTWKNTELGEGFRDYIEGILRTKLLYKDEKDQNIYFNSQIQSKELSIRTEYSRIYGAVHLIRLMSQLGHWLSYYPLDAFSKTFLEDSISEFSVFLDNKKKDYVKSEDYVLIQDYNYTFLYNSEGDEEKAIEENNEGTELNSISMEGDEEKAVEKNNERTELNSISVEGDEENNEGSELNNISVECDEEKAIEKNNEGTELNSISMDGNEENNEGTELKSISVEGDEENNEGAELNNISVVEVDEENNEGVELNSIPVEGDEENNSELNSISVESDDENNESSELNSISLECDEENNEGSELNSISVESDEENNEGSELNNISVEGDEEKATEKNNEGAELNGISVEGGSP